jgi:hypothetical protein
MVHRIRKPSFADEDDPVGWRPIPDPTILTTQQIHRELGALRDILEARLEASDKAIVLLQNIANRQPTVGEVVAEMRGRFGAIEVELVEREKRFLRITEDSNRAVDAALITAKEAVNKSEANVTKTIDGISTLIASGAKSQDDKVNDLRDRVTAIEGRGQAYSQGFGWIATAVGIVAAVVGAIVAVFFKGEIGG